MIIITAEYLYAGAALLCIIRILIGPTFGDRVISLDALSNLIVLFMVVYATRMQSPIYLDIALTFALLSFVGILSIAKWVKKFDRK